MPLIRIVTGLLTLVTLRYESKLVVNSQVVVEQKVLCNLRVQIQIRQVR